MFKKIKNNRKLQKGFTIIEVMIVLAIAGLILVVVLVAIPQLQRNQRNESRRSVASRITTEINNFAGNNNGSIPIASTTGAAATDASNFGTPATAFGFFDRYLGCNAPVAPATTPTCSTNINDARTGTPVGTGADGTPGPLTNLTTVAGTTVATVVPGNVAGSIAYGTGLICSGENPIAGSNRNFVFLMRLEGGAVFCLDNK